MNIGSLLPLIKHPDARTPRTPEAARADEMYRHFNKSIPFMQLRGLIKYKGLTFVREQFLETIKTDHPNHKALFLWRVAQVKPQLQ